MNYIFDFDGTLADSLDAFVEVFNDVVRGKTHPLSHQEIERFRGMSSRQALKRAHVRWWQIPQLVLKGLHEFHALLPTMPSFPGLPATVKKLYERGDKLFIVSSNTRDNIGQFLSQHDMYDYFAEIDSSVSLFKKSKHIRKLIRSYGLKRKETFYIGDETRDIQAGRRARVKVVAVSWGFNHPKILRKYRPDYLLDKPEDLLGIK